MWHMSDSNEEVKPEDVVNDNIQDAEIEEDEEEEVAVDDDDEVDVVKEKKNAD